MCTYMHILLHSDYEPYGCVSYEYVHKNPCFVDKFSTSFDFTNKTTYIEVDKLIKNKGNI